MHVVVARSADEAWLRAARLVIEEGTVQPSRLGLAREVRPVVLEIAAPQDRVVFSRPINPALGVAETIWMLAGANDAAFLRFWNPRLSNYLDGGESAFHGAYGYRLGCRPRLSAHAEAALRRERRHIAYPFDQLRRAAEVLSETPFSRQVVLQMWNGAEDFPDPKPRSLDIPCNVFGQLLIRDNKLEWVESMRSTDLVWGLPYNLIQWTSLQEIVSGWIGAEVGSYHHFTNSLHAYQRHWDELPRWISTGGGKRPSPPESLRIEGYEQWEAVFGALVDRVLRMYEASTVEDILDLAEDLSPFPAGYRQWVALLAADAAARRGSREASKEVISKAGGYWATSWLSWDAEVRSIRRQSGLTRQVPTTSA